MPHKHHRQRNGEEKSFDLPPSAIAKPLPAFQKDSKIARKGNKDARDRKPRDKQPAAEGYKENDTPRAFARLMQLQSGKRPRSGLDDGESRKSKKRKTRGDEKITEPLAEKKKSIADETSTPRIQPGERLSDFAVRVNQMMPMGGLIRKGGKIEGMKERQTKTEKRLQKMYAEWRKEEARRKEKLEDLRDEEEEEMADKETELGGQSISFPSERKSKKTRADDEEDPWKVLETKRGRRGGLHDVVQAPPVMKTVPREIFKVKNGAQVDVANVPGAAGSLKRREELSSARREVIERYRQMAKTRP